MTKINYVPFVTLLKKYWATLIASRFMDARIDVKQFMTRNERCIFISIFPEHSKKWTRNRLQ